MLEVQGQTDSQWPVDEIWALEAVDHGDAAVINQQSLSSIGKPLHEPGRRQKDTNTTRS